MRARLSQFPLSFLAKSRWAPRSSGELRFRAMPPLPVNLQLKKIERRQAAYKPVALTLRHVQWAIQIAIATNLERLRFLLLVDPLWLSLSLSEHHLERDDLSFFCGNSVETYGGRQRSVLLY